MSDIFQEVDEEVRREQLKKLWERYGNYLVALCVLIVVGVGGWRGYEWWQAKQAAAIRRGLRAGRDALPRPASIRRPKRPSPSSPTDGTAGYRVLARLREAAELAPTDSKAAVSAYDAIAADNSAGQAIQDLAAVRAGYLLVDTAPYAELRARLEPLTAADRPFRHSAREILALSAWKSGDMAAARQWTDMIMTDPQTPSGTRSRAEVLSELIAANSKG